MKALRAALEDLEVEDPTLAKLEKSIQGLTELADYAEQQEEVPVGISMESIFESFRPRDFNVQGRPIASLKLAMEEIHDHVWAIIVAAAIAIAAAVAKFMNWSFGAAPGSSGGGGGGGSGHISVAVTKVKATAKVIEQQEVKVVELNQELQSAAVSVPVEENSSTTVRINTLDDALKLLPDNEARVNPALLWLKKPDMLSLDVINEGEFMKMMEHVMEHLQTDEMAAFEQEMGSVKELVQHPEKLDDATIAKIEKIYHDLTQKPVGPANKPLPALIHEINEKHQQLASSRHEEGISFADIMKKMHKAMQGPISELEKIVEGTKEIMGHVQTVTEEIQKAAQEVAHKVEQSAAGSSDKETGDRLAKVLHMVGETTRLMASALRITYIVAKSMLNVARHIQQAARIALRMLKERVVSRLESEETKKRVQELITELTNDFKKYEL